MRNKKFLVCCIALNFISSLVGPTAYSRFGKTVYAVEAASENFKKQFDFTMADGLKEDDWIDIVVGKTLANGGAVDVDEVGSRYTAEKGYGFTTGWNGEKNTLDGRANGGKSTSGTFISDSNYPIPNDVSTSVGFVGDSWGNWEFAVDVPASGTYTVRVFHFQQDMVASGDNVSFDTTMEGTKFSSPKAQPQVAQSYAHDIEVTDGQLNIKFSGKVGRISGLMVEKKRNVDVTAFDQVKKNAEAVLQAGEKYTPASFKVVQDSYSRNNYSGVLATSQFALDEATADLKGALDNLIVRSTDSSTKEEYYFNFTNQATLVDGWKNVVVATGQSNEDTASQYDAEKGYGFTDSTVNYLDDGQQNPNKKEAYDIPQEVLSKTAYLRNKQFVVDLANGEYTVQLIHSPKSITKEGFDTLNLSIEGVPVTGTAQAGSYSVTETPVTLTDGVLTFDFNAPAYNALAGIVIKKQTAAPQNLQVESYDAAKGTATISFDTTGKSLQYQALVKGNDEEKSTIINVAENATNHVSATINLPRPGNFAWDIDVFSQEEPFGVLKNYQAVSSTVNLSIQDEQTPLPGKVTTTTFKDVQAGSITISWPQSSGASSYIIYRALSESAPFEKLIETTDTSYTDKNEKLIPSRGFLYKIESIGVGGRVISDIFTSPITITYEDKVQEKINDRALVAVNLAGDQGGVNLTATDANGESYTKGVFVSWRALKEDQQDTLYTLKRNGRVIVDKLSVTNLVDPEGSASDKYEVIGSTDEKLGIKSKEVSVWENYYQKYSLKTPADQTMPDGTVCSYTANDLQVADLNGDGDLELIVKWYPTNAQDNSKGGYTGSTILDGYDIDWNEGTSTFLWRVDLGINIRSGAHYTQFSAWDYDGDGGAELMVLTADGTKVYDQNLNLVTTLGDSEKDYRIGDVPSDNSRYGRPLGAPEYVAAFDGTTGTFIDRIEHPYQYDENPKSKGYFGDEYGNRGYRFNSTVAYLDGVHPNYILQRGYYARTTIAAYQLQDGKLSVTKQFDTAEEPKYNGQGNHGIEALDVDNDGRDEVVIGSLCFDDDLKPLSSTGLGHGDAMHISDWIPSHPGLEVMQVHEEAAANYHVEIHDPVTGEILTGYFVGNDTGRGVAGDIDPTSPGAEFWANRYPGLNSTGVGTIIGSNSTGLLGKAGTQTGEFNILNETGVNMETLPAVNFTLFWDGDLLTELQDASNDGPITITKWDYLNNKSDVLLSADQTKSNNGTKGNAGLVADLLGDWREEILSRSANDNNTVTMYTTTIQTDYVVPCLLENDTYRKGIAWQQASYNQPINLDYLLSEGVLTAEISPTLNEEGYIVWTPASDGTYGHEVTGYYVYRDGKLIGETNEEKYFDVTTDGENHQYQVAAKVNNRPSYPSHSVELRTNEFGGVQVSYLDETNQELAPMQLYTGKVGSAYTIEPLTISGYELVANETPLNGTYTLEVATAYFHYKKVKTEQTEGSKPATDSSTSAEDSAKDQGTLQNSSENLDSKDKGKDQKPYPQTGEFVQNLFGILGVGILVLTGALAMLKKKHN
ncbi:rhamnogalacturonan lyase family protein [Enterococcus nangangensis]